MNAESSIPSETYWNWVPAADAYRKLLRHFEATDPTVAALLQRLRGGLLLSSAQLLTHGKDEVAYPAILPALWKRAIIGAQSHLWINNNIDVDLRIHGPYIELQDEDLISLIGVRFDPEGLSQIAPLFGSETASNMEASAEPTKRRQDLPLLADSIAQAWIRWYKAEPGATKQKAEQAALHMFPNHNLSRDTVRSLWDGLHIDKP